MCSNFEAFQSRSEYPIAEHIITCTSKVLCIFNVLKTSKIRWNNIKNYSSFIVKMQNKQVTITRSL